MLAVHQNAKEQAASYARHVDAVIRALSARCAASFDPAEKHRLAESIEAHINEAKRMRDFANS